MIVNFYIMTFLGQNNQLLTHILNCKVNLLWFNLSNIGTIVQKQLLIIWNFTLKLNFKK